MTNQGKENYNAKQYFEEIIKDSLKVFETLTTWSEQDFDDYSLLLDELKKPYDKKLVTTKEKGDRLENLVSFIIRKSFFFEVSCNVTTGTNEIDDVITLSANGKQALTSFNISRELLEIDTDIFLGECKNYKSNLNVMYVGKFYSLMVATDISFGILFTQEGLTGKENEYRDAYGLVKVLRIVEKYRNKRNFFIIDFTMDDYEKLLKGKTFYELIHAKKLSLQLASEYDHFLTDYQHENEQNVKTAIQSLK